MPVTSHLLLGVGIDVGVG